MFSMGTIIGSNLYNDDEKKIKKIELAASNLNEPIMVQRPTGLGKIDVTTDYKRAVLDDNLNLEPKSKQPLESTNINKKPIKKKDVELQNTNP